jgi:3-oxoacyl-[acyl-carrier protein] reductase
MKTGNATTRGGGDVGFLEERADLANRVAVIVGGGGGLGRAIAVDLARAGVHLGLLDRNEQLLADTVSTAERAGVGVTSMTGDGRDPEVLAHFFAQTDEAFDRLDILVNVVGGTFRQLFSESNPRGWEALIRTNFTWLLHAIQMAIPRMRAGGRGGSIINLTSIEGHRAAPNFAVYAGMKAAVTNFGRSLAVELAGEGIRVNAIAADMVPTEGSRQITAAQGDAAPWGDEDLSLLTARIGIPMGSRGRYEDVGSCALFLASDLSKYITGSTLHPDGGALASSGWFNWPDVGYLNLPPASVLKPLGGRPSE